MVKHRCTMIAWLLNPLRREVAQAHRSAALAEAEVVQSAERLRKVKRQTAHSTAVNDALQREIVRNGWTELLQNAWGAR
ncbi:hypothetical protein RitSun_42 [Mycobacterium phage RitSun]|uniref:Uncharacterized protein n=3 Tax=Gracegardnervirinae TaxID=2946632 RepID=A0A2D1G9R8_9CAUD|nr:hypothetical protein PBI_CHE9D_39 [Mycobacterium phage Che9d]YP_009848853.1 hypothetical protein HWC44_gp034 [Mycobacterium phage ThetaBob]YP_009963738.1 hypothetical protein I5I02_gp040 [Mycobacterium phage Demsculpinboyz]QXG07412.1 hypothetical protein RitSun_42 [Mycobacterium phage RitSun]AAN07957.1 hypothetical protein PBI_CHE9D_39 [Mycobacterium phage Che9d]ATN88635.1 hypothetical protein SEA_DEMSCULPINBOYZ_40 [Mycobacterium phage Demsculpinboyz]QDF19921.1 hypothetical protein SEA_THE